MKSMLIVDSSQIVAKLFAGIFEGRGWSVAVCGDQRSALGRLAGDDEYDAILLGYRVPEADSAGLVRFIRSLEHRRTTAIVMVTGDEDRREEGLAAGADEVLIRPLNPNALIWAVDKHVR